MIEQYRRYKGNKGEGLEKILGNQAKIGSFAAFWEQNGDELEVIAAYFINRFNTEREYTKEELNCYREGLADMAGMFSRAWIEKNEKLVE